MKQRVKIIFALALVSILASLSVSAETQEKMVIALKTSDFELAETDISSLAVGESKTIETGSGKVIDIIKTRDGAEIYVDGELLDIDHMDEGHEVKKHVEINCDDEENCEKDVIVIAADADELSDLSELVSGEGDRVIIHKEIIHACDDGDEGSSCPGEVVWIEEDGDVGLDELHQLHEGEGAHKVIVIRKEVVSED